MSKPNLKEMNAAEIQELTLSVLADKLDVDKAGLTLDSSLVNDLGMDSFGAVELMFGLENQYGIEIPEKDAQTFTRIGDIVQYLLRRAKE